MQREIIKWLQSLDLSNVVQNPKRDLATGHAAAEIVCRYSGTKLIDLQRLPSGASAATKRDIWLQVYHALQKLKCESVTPQLIDAVLRREPNAALTVLECLYEHFTGYALPMRGLDAVGTANNAYVQPANAASTAKLLAVANGSVKPRLKDGSSTLYDPLERATSPKGTFAAARSAAGQDGKRFTADSTSDAHKHNMHSVTTEDFMGTSPTARERATRTLQQRLALIDNDELAGGANALEAYPRYARPTASTLVHAATGTRKDVILDRPKYVVDETHQRAQNTRIAQQHAVVQRLQEETVSGKTTQQQQQGDGALSSSWPALMNATGGGGTLDALPLTAVYRGRFYREPEPSCASGTAKSSKGRGGGLPALGGGKAASTHPVARDDAGDEMDGAAASQGRTDDASGPMLQEKGGHRVGSAGNNARAVPKLRVQVHSTALKTALALRSGDGQLYERAAALSRELFAKHQYRLRPAVSEILADVLSAHKQLEHLLDCSCEDGRGEVLENVLGHLLAHRQAFPMSCMRACWETLSQHVEGIAATLQHSADEYSYLIECFAFAFTREASQVPVLHLPSSLATPTSVIDGYGDAFDAAAAAEERGEAVGSAVADAHASAATSAGDEEEEKRRKDDEETGAQRSTAASSMHSSLDKTATAATRRASEAPPSAAELGTPRHLSTLYMQQQQQQQLALQHQRAQLPIIVNARQQMDLASVFDLLCRVARQMDVITAGYVLRRYALRAARPFLLRHGTAAVREVVARLLSASFTTVTPAAGENAEGAQSTTTAASDAETAFVSFLTTDLVTCVLTSSTAATTSRSPLLPAPDGAEDALNSSLLRERVLKGAVPRQRAYYHILLHAVADFTAASLAAGEALAHCVQAAAAACLNSSDIELRAMGVGLVRQCCERWWRPVEEGCGDEAKTRATSERTRDALHELIAHVLAATDAPEDPSSSDPAACWDLKAVGAWELRMMVLRLCVTLLEGAPHLGVHGTSGEEVGRAADAAAAVCLSAFGAVATSTTACPSPASTWQLQLALAESGGVVDPTRTPAMTAQWTELLAREVALTSLSGCCILPGDGVAVHLLLTALHAFDGAKTLLATKTTTPPPLRLTSPTAASQRTEHLFSGDRPNKVQMDTKDNGRGSVQSSRTQRAATHPALGDTAASLPSPPEHVDAPLQLLRGRVCSTYTVVPVYRAWSTRGVLETVPPAKSESDRGAASSLLPLQVLVAALLPGAAPVRPDSDEGEFWSAVTRRFWPLLAVDAIPVEAISAHPPPFISFHDTSEARGDVLAVVAVALFLRASNEAAVASAVSASGEDWRALCAIAMRWAATLAEQSAADS